MPPADPFFSTFHEWVEIFMHRSMCRFIHHARKSGLSMSMIGTLFHLHHKESMGVTDLGEHLGVTSAAASQMLDRLVQLGLIQRSEDPDDRRVKILVLTEKGFQALEEGMRAQQDWIKELSDTLSAEEKDKITSAMNLMIEKVNQIS